MDTNNTLFSQTRPKGKRYSLEIIFEFKQRELTEGLWHDLSEQLSEEAEKKEENFYRLILAGRLKEKRCDALLQNSSLHPSLINAEDEDGLTALHWAARKNIKSTEFFVQLLASGGDPNRTDPEGRTVLDYVIDRYEACKNRQVSFDNTDPLYYNDLIRLKRKKDALFAWGAKTSRQAIVGECEKKAITQCLMR